MRTDRRYSPSFEPRTPQPPQPPRSGLVQRPNSAAGVPVTLYGVEMLLDLKDCELDDLSPERLEQFVIQLCDLIGMKRHGKPLFWVDNSGIPHLHGVSIVQFIETSTIVCHVPSLLKTVFLNLFSCKEFDTAAAQRFCVAFWRAKSVAATVVPRTLPESA